MRKILIIVLVFFSISIFAFLHYYNRWKSMWQLEVEHPAYSIAHPVDDTLRIAIIGDSWAVIHSETMMDTLLASQLNHLTGHPVIVRSKGKGGENSRGIYKLMFKSERLGTRPIIASGLDYCVVIAGINDAAGNLGTREYCHHMKLILKFLLSN